MADVEIVNNGTIVTLIGCTPAGHDWLRDNVVLEEPYHGQVVADHRMAGNIIEGMIDDGLSVE